MLNMKTLQERLRLALRVSGLKQTDIAKACHVTKGAVNQWFTGATKALEGANLTNAARTLGVSPHWLATGQGDMVDESARVSHQTVKWVDSVGEPIKEWNDEADLNPDEFVIIPRYAITVSAGNGHFVHEELQLHQGQAYRVDWLKAMGLKGHDLKSIKATGDSMLPTFGDGCTLLVDFSHKQISEGKVYVIRFGDEIRVKRIHKRADGGIIIRSDNRDAYPDINIPPDEMGNIEILGRVRHYSGDL